MSSPGPRSISQSTSSTNLADLLERILDKGLVVAGDIRVNLVEIELLSIQIRLLVCSVDKARELGIDWWSRDRQLSGKPDAQLADTLRSIESRLARIESAALPPSGAAKP
jgi:hypothetical protein